VGLYACPVPVEPPPSPWHFPDPDQWPQGDFIALGADLAPGTLLEAYRRGIFPMPDDTGRGPQIGWWSPMRRGILPLDGLRVTRSLRKSAKRFEIRVDSAFEEVVVSCADPDRWGGWITTDIIDAYVRLHELGWAHSVEAWRDGSLVGGLYGVGIGGLFAGESMFHRERDGSKVALAGLVDLLRSAGGPRLLDVQWQTPHLESLGVVTCSRTAYLSCLDEALALPDAFT
jgi:leucyl/phenylalanyl-tRNA--protein transferase